MFEGLSAAAPRPYIIEPPLSTETVFSTGATFTFNLVLLGDINQFFPHFFYAFYNVGETGIGKNRSRFTITSVLDDQGEVWRRDVGSLLRVRGAFHLPAPQAVVSQGPCEETTALVRLITPLRFKFRNRFQAELPFDVLIRVVLRRISSVWLYFAGSEPALDYRGLVHHAARISTLQQDLHWVDIKRFSSRQEAEMLIGGLQGSVCYRGDFRPFMELLNLASVLHVGKQTTFGLGQMSVEYGVNFGEWGGKCG